MPQFNSLADAKTIVLAAWYSFRQPTGVVHSAIGTDAVEITWAFHRGTMDASTDDYWEFTGDQDALTAWWRDYGADYDVLPAEYKGPAVGYQINLQYIGPGHETWFNYHLSVPDPEE